MERILAQKLKKHLLDMKTSGSDHILIRDARPGRVEVRKENFTRIIGEFSAKKIGFVDGGQACLLMSPELSVHLIRTACVIMHRKEVAQTIKDEFYIIAKAAYPTGGSGAEPYDGKHGGTAVSIEIIRDKPEKGKKAEDDDIFAAEKRSWQSSYLLYASDLMRDASGNISRATAVGASGKERSADASGGVQLAGTPRKEQSAGQTGGERSADASEKERSAGTSGGERSADASGKKQSAGTSGGKRSADAPRGIPYGQSTEGTDDLMPGTQMMNAAANLIRRIAELDVAAAAAQMLSEGDLIMLDGNLETMSEVENAHMAALSERCRQDNVLLCAMAKTSSMITLNRRSVNAVLFEQGPSDAWLYHPVATIDGKHHHAMLCFVRLHKNSGHVFGLEIDSRQAAMADIKKIASFLKVYSNDAAFPGYPYGLIRSDSAARVSAREKEFLRTRLITSLGKDIMRLEPGMNALNAHDILDNIG